MKARQLIEFVISVIVFCSAMALLSTGVLYVVEAVICWLAGWPFRLLSWKAFISAFLLFFVGWLAVVGGVSPNVEE